MKKHILLFASLLVALSGKAQDAEVTIDVSNPSSRINKEIYGQFAEHLG